MIAPITSRAATSVAGGTADTPSLTNMKLEPQNATSAASMPQSFSVRAATASSAGFLRQELREIVQQFPCERGRYACIRLRNADAALLGDVDVGDQSVRGDDVIHLHTQA